MTEDSYTIDHSFRPEKLTKENITIFTPETLRLQKQKCVTFLERTLKNTIDSHNKSIKYHIKKISDYRKGLLVLDRLDIRAQMNVELITNTFNKTEKASKALSKMEKRRLLLKQLKELDDE